MKRSTSLFLCFASVGFLGMFAWQAEAQLATPTCPQTITGSTFTGGTLTTPCANPTATGCTVQAGTSVSGSVIQLSNSGGTFASTQVNITSTLVFAAVGDFNKDGWADFVGAPLDTTSSPLQVFSNQTWQNENCTTPACTAFSGAAPNWSSGTPVTAKFVPSTNLHALTATAYKGTFTLGAGDFNGDGWDDVFELYAAGGPPTSGYSKMNMYLNKAANASTGCTNSPVSTNPPATTPVANHCAQFKVPYNAATASLNEFTNSTIKVGDVGTNIQVLDYNGDGHLDVLVGTDESNGSIHILTSTCTEVVPTVFTPAGFKKCSSDPTFTDGGYLMQNLRYSNVYAASGTAEAFVTSAEGQPIFYYGDYDGDGMRDLLVGSPDCCTTSTRRIRLFKGCAASNVPSPGTCGTNKLLTVASQSLPGTAAGTPFPGAADAMLLADFTLDGKIDALIGTDGAYASRGGESWLWKNTGTSTPFSAYSTQITFRGTGPGQAIDYDVGFLFDYDHDPNNSPDALLADGNGTGNYYLLANRSSNQYVSCGEVQGTVDVGTVSTSDSVITSARISAAFANVSPPTRTIQMFASNSTDETSWVGPLSNCSVAPLTDYCATFTKPVGQTVRWKAKLCTTDPNTTPQLSSVGVKYDYRAASEHYRSGVAVNDGVVYVGAFRQPGERGKFYAVNAGLANTTPPYYWEAGSKLDAMADGDRKIYTAVSGSQLEFTAANATASSAFRTLLNGDATTAPALVTWARNARFGYGSPTSPLTKLGSIVSSSPAILSKPGRPTWYAFGTSAERGYADTFVSQKATRVPLTMFGSKDGMVHAVYTIPTNLADTRNGKEAWAYVPPTVVGSMMADKTALEAANSTANDGLNHPPSTAKYPDGSPTLLDYYSGATVKTVALVSEGNGGRNFSVFDVTQTVNPSTGVVSGPLPMWNATAGDSDAGFAYAKPTVARVSINGSTRFVVMAATGIDPNDTSPSPNALAKGRIVTGYDLANGSVLWKFQAKCPVTSELTAFETDDALEPSPPTLDGNIDRVVFADDCGYVYKLDPAVNLSGGWLANTGMGATNTGTNPAGGISWALFATSNTGALGATRTIAGTIGARIDSSTRMILYFGTGGSESVPANLPNEFYAVYADTGAIRSKYVGTCVSSQCEKFYGGVVVTPTQIIFTRTVDPAVAVSTCDDGSSVVQAYQLNANGSGSFVPDFQENLTSAVMGALYGDAGAIYFATLGGDVKRVGTPRAASAGGDTSTNQTQGTGTSQNGVATGTSGSAFTLLGWRVVL